MNVLHDFSRTSTVVEPSAMSGRDWKAMMNPLFVIPSSIKINSFYIFEARKESPGVLFAKKYSN